MTTPLAEDDFEPHWTALAAGRIVIPRCEACGRHSWPPRPACRRCHDLRWSWAEVPPLATVYTWTVVHHQTMAGHPPPYAVVLAELDHGDGVRLLGHYGADAASLQIGLAVRATGVVDPAGVRLVWQPAGQPPSTPDSAGEVP
jgi:uncharacterized OB-fold protein